MKKNMRFRQVHLDFHTSEQIQPICDRFVPALFAEQLRAAHVNSVTCFARCHHGMIYYDTRFPAHHPGLECDLLAQQISACHDLDIKVPVYLSMGLDEYQARLHPEWVERLPDGRPGIWNAGPLVAMWKKLCFNSPYLDYAIDQMNEVIERFGNELDGLFFDIILQGDCCCENCLATMQQQGLDPTDSEHRSSHSRQVLAAFKQRVYQTIQAQLPGCPVFFNSGHVGPGLRDSLDCYSHLEIESLPSGGWGYDHFPVTVRYARKLGLPYLGMTGRFHKNWGDFGGYKTQAALEYECFSALAHGAGCSIGDQLAPHGALEPHTYKLIGQVYKQVESREEWCCHAQSVPEIAVVSPEAVPSNGQGLHESACGVQHMLDEEHLQYDFVDLSMDLSQYPVVILPDVITLSEQETSLLQKYLADGGKVLATHYSAMAGDHQKFLLPPLDTMQFHQPGPEVNSLYVGATCEDMQDALPVPHILYENGLLLAPVSHADVLAEVWAPYFYRAWNHFCSHSQTPPDKPAGHPAMVDFGNVIYCSQPLFGMYRRHGLLAYRQMVMTALMRLLKEPIVTTNAPSTAQISVMYQPQHQRYVVHILHYIPQRRSQQIDLIEDVVPLHDVSISLRLPLVNPVAVAEPEGLSLPVEQTADGRINLVLPVVKGYGMVALSSS